EVSGLRCFFARLVKQERERLLGANLAGDAAERALLLQFGAHHGYGLALLAGVALHFAVELFLSSADGLAVGNLVQNQRSAHVPFGAFLLRIANLLPVQLERS